MSSAPPDRLEIDGLSIAPALAEFVATEAAPAVGVDPNGFWSGLATIVRDLLPRHDELLRHRDDIQQRIDDWHRSNPGPVDAEAYRGFLEANGYLRDEPTGVSVELSAVDPDLARRALREGVRRHDRLGRSLPATLVELAADRRHRLENTVDRQRFAEVNGVGGESDGAERIVDPGTDRPASRLARQPAGVVVRVDRRAERDGFGSQRRHPRRFGVEWR